MGRFSATFSFSSALVVVRDDAWYGAAMLSARGDEANDRGWQDNEIETVAASDPDPAFGLTI